MAGKNAYTDEQLIELLRTHGSAYAASRATGIKADTFKRRGITIKTLPVVAEPLPPDDIPVSEIIDRLTRDYEVKERFAKAEQVRTHRLKIKGPFALQWFGDPHMDDALCNWPQLKRDIAIAKSSEAILPCNMGDSLNNWVGSLQRLYAHQNVSESRALKLYEWFVAEVPWYLWLFGNHCLWPTRNSGVMQQIAKTGASALADWAIKVNLELPNGRLLKIHAAHNFKGSSAFNVNHGLLKEALETGGEHDIVVAGDHHIWGTGKHEHPRTGKVFSLIRARGYKGSGEYEKMNGFRSQNHGHSVMTVINPDRDGPGYVQTFEDAELGADFLKFLRRKL